MQTYDDEYIKKFGVRSEYDFGTVAKEEIYEETL